MRRAVLVATAALAAVGACVVDSPRAHAVTGAAVPAASTRLPVPSLKIMNYYPGTAGWQSMWTQYSHATIMSDFSAIKSLNANAVRIIVQPYAVGYPVVAPARRAELDDMISAARSDGLAVQLSLFDEWHSYTDVRGSEQWVNSLLYGETTNPTIALVELQNEMPLQSSSVSWAKTMLPYLHSALPGVPRTVSEPGSGGEPAIAALLSDVPASDLDAIDVHYYGDPSLAATELEQVGTIAKGRPVFIGETGISTLNTAAGEEAQVRFYELMGQTARDLGLPPPSPWMLNDVTKAAGINLTTTQAYYGLRRPNGTWKQAAAVISSLFRGVTPENWDGNMAAEAVGLAPVLGAWTEFDARDGAPKVVSGKSYNGGQSICFSGTGGSRSALPSVEEAFPILVKNEYITVSGYVERQGGTGHESISVAGFDARHNYVGEGDSAGASGSGYWQKLSVSGTVPSGIASVQIHLKAGYESGTACWSDVTITTSAH